jgi:centromere/kinetochore protein ZW10
VHTLWKQILPISALTSATGSLVNAVATKLINDVFDLSDMGVDEAERTARLIAKVTELDDLFIREPERGRNGNGEEEIPMTAQFADKWMKMKFLSEVLQSNLKDIKFFWFESDLSLYFSKEEVVDLINLSFEKNASVRQMIKEILQKPLPGGLNE